MVVGTVKSVVRVVKSAVWRTGIADFEWRQMATLSTVRWKLDVDNVAHRRMEMEAAARLYGVAAGAQYVAVAAGEYNVIAAERYDGSRRDGMIW